MQKEAYAIVQTFDRMDYLFWGSQPVQIFTGHRNLLYVSAPKALRTNSPRHVLSEVHKWAIHLSRFLFFNNHIEGSKNIFTEVLTQWSKGYSKTTAQRVAALYGDIVHSTGEMNTVTMAEMVREQSKCETPVTVNKNTEGICKNDDQV